MLTIRRIQFDVLRRGIRTRFGSDVVAALALDSPEAVCGLSHNEVALRLSDSLDYADRYQLRAERDLRCFLRMCFLIAHDFAAMAPFDALLARCCGRMDVVFAEASPEQWERAMIAAIVRRARPTPMQHGAAIRSAPAIDLVPLALAHAVPLWRYGLHPDVWRLTGTSPLLTLDDVEQDIRRAGATPGERYAMVDEDGCFVGALTLIPRHTNALLSYWVRRDRWGHGIANAAVRELIAIEHRRQRYSHLEAEVHPSNALSQRVLRKAGFAVGRCDATDIFNRFSCQVLP